MTYLTLTPKQNKTLVNTNCLYCKSKKLSIGILPSGRHQVICRTCRSRGPEYSNPSIAATAFSHRSVNYRKQNLDFFKPKHTDNL